MMRRMFMLKVVFAIVLPVSGCLAANPDRWKRLVLNEATPEQAVSSLGAPQRDETGELWKLARGKMFNISSMYFLMARKSDAVRVLKYEGVENFKTVSLIFKADKLVMIHLEPSKENKVPARDLKGLYEQCIFRPAFSDREFWSQDYVVDQASGKLRPKYYPTIYRLIGVSAKLDGIVVGTIENVGVGRVLAQSMGNADAETPGRAYIIDLVSLLMLPPKPMNKSLE